jgi:hypothetical protein
MRIRRHITFANVAASVALLTSLTGTAYAATMITGFQIKDGTVTGADIKNGGLSTSDLSTLAISKLKGATGPKGDQGPAGPTGAAAKLSVSWGSRDTGEWQTPASQNVSQQPWYSRDDDGVAGADSKVAGEFAPEIAYQPFSSIQPQVSINGDGAGPLSFDYNAAVNGMATVTVLHQGTVHTRMECQLWAKDMNSSTQNAMGDPVYASSNTDKELVTLSLVGSKNISVFSGTKNYDVQVRCRDADRTGNPQDTWTFVRGSVTAFAASEA